MCGLSRGLGIEEKEAVAGLAGELRNILDQERLLPVFQPILEMSTGAVHGFEGLVRGPSDSLLHSPLALFRVAKREGLVFELERLCCRSLTRAFSTQGVNSRLFLNITPDSFVSSSRKLAVPMDELQALGLSPERVVIELTECQLTFDYHQLLRAAERYRALGFSIALDDLGEGFSSLRLWSDLRPEYVKIDKHFVQGVSEDPVKHQFLRSLSEMAGKTGALVVAEGVETEADFEVVRELELDCGQGYLFGRPGRTPVATAPASLFLQRRTAPESATPPSRLNRVTPEHLLVGVEPLTPDVPVRHVHERFASHPELLSIPVVREGIPLGIINRYGFMDAMVRPFSLDLLGKKPCETLMNRSILVVDSKMGLDAVSHLMVESDPRHLLNGFIITRDGLYAGMGSGHDLMREITRMQISAAQYANPLTGLPGNVPINEHLEDLIQASVPFVVCYCDLDHFKPYNDVYGYRKGDEVIQWTGRLLASVCDPPVDFLGHIGGDDFLLMLRHPAWEDRCQRALRLFEGERARFFDERDLARGGYFSEDRGHRMVFHPLLSLSMGAVRVQPGVYADPYKLSSAAAIAKKEAKRMEGCSLFIERRRLCS